MPEWRRPFRSLRLRMLALLLLVLVAGALVTAGATYRRALAQSEEQSDYQLMQMALSLRDHGEVGDVRALKDERQDLSFQIWTPDGRLVYSSRPPHELPDRVALGYAQVVVGQELWRTFSVATPLRVIQVAQPQQVRERMAVATAWAAVQPVLLVALLMVATSWWVTGLMLLPLKRLSQSLKALEANSIEEIPPADHPQELQPLVVALNDLLRRLREAWHAQRRFVADAAHELRSPLTALKLQMHLLRQQPPGADWQEPLAAARQSSERMGHLVEQLLQLARAQDPPMATEAVPVDLAELSRQQMAALAPLAAQRQATLELQAPASAWVSGSAPALASLVRNLLENALWHNPPGVHVQVVLEPGAQGLEWVVQDNGVGIAPPDREAVFDRFVRRAGADVPGTGLGLAIVRAVAERHGASVSLHDSPLGGLQVRVRGWVAAPAGGATGPSLQ